MLRQTHGVIQLSEDSPAQRAEEATEAALDGVRREMATHLLATPHEDLAALYSGPLGQTHRHLRSRVKLQAKWNQLDRECVARALAILAPTPSEPQATAALLVAMLYIEPHDLPGVLPFELVPPWLLDDYGRFMTTPPALFLRVGEAEQYGRHLLRWLQYLHRGVLSHPHDQLWTAIRNFALQALNFISVYFNELNLRELYQQRAEIFEFTLKMANHPLDYVFPLRVNRPRIRLGILAAHFAPQTETFATLPAYELLDRRVFEIVLFAVQRTNSALEQYCASRADHFVALPGDLAQRVSQIRAADLDFLLIGTNVTAVTNDTTVLALHRLARVQIALVPSCTTSGMKNVDYYLSGSLSEPSMAAEQHYTERLLRVDGPAHCYDFATERPLAPTQSITREMLGIPAGATVFISGANFYKITPEVEEVWTRILAENPGSYLILYPFNPNWSNAYPVETFLRRFSVAAVARGVSAERVCAFAPAPHRGDVLARLRLGDIYLDSFPFSGATSLLDPLEVGLPSLVMDGTTFRALVGPALLRSIDLEDLVARDAESYIALASQLAKDPKLRASYSARIATAMQARPKFLNPEWYAGEITSLLLKVWRERLGPVVQPQ